MKTLTRSLVCHAHAVARETNAHSVLLYADVIDEKDELAGLIADVDFRVILVSRRADFQIPVSDERKGLCSVVRVPDFPMTRAGQIKIATLVAATESLLKAGERVVCLTGIDGSGAIDTIMVLDLGSELELFASTAAEPPPPDVKPAVFERLLTIACELGLEGREGRPVGTIFILGDDATVLSRSRQLVINPFHGYPEEQRNILDARLEETIKEFAAIDGAFVIRGDGVLLSAGRYLAPQDKPEEPLPRGLGARHEAAAAITSDSTAIALCVSQSTGSVSIFKQGRLVADIQKPRSRSQTEF